MTPTRLRLLVALAVVAAALGWGLLVATQGRSGRVVPVPWLAAATMWFLAVALLLWTLLARPRLQRKEGHRPLSPFVAARTAALAMAASRTGSLVAGFYIGLGLAVIPSRESPAGSASLWAAGLTALGSIALVAVALWLERLCRLPNDGDNGGGQRVVPPSPRGEPGSASARIGSSHERPDAT